MKSLEILKKNEMVKKYVEPNYLNEAIEELESLKCCQNCKHYSMFDGKIECKTCFAINHTNWEIRPLLGAFEIKGDNYE